MRCSELKIYALWDVQGYKNIMVMLSWKRSITFMFEEIFAPILPYAIQTISPKVCVKRYTATAKALWCIQKNSIESTKFNRIYIYFLSVL